MKVVRQQTAGVWQPKSFPHACGWEYRVASNAAKLYDYVNARRWKGTGFRQGHAPEGSYGRERPAGAFPGFERVGCFVAYSRMWTNEEDGGMKEWQLS
ncbi:hypothetical protein WMW72_09930 [Paenibacillus filicis]|uniref:Uncharacterized protein n=1 Tax=Paenibacillus filicis TaxID=669464 RepID=A0ABU9DJ05_9BACL